MTFFTLWSRHAGAASPAPQDVRDALVMLDRTGCALCRVRDSSTETWTRWFVIESHTDVPTLSRLKDALGCCPAHTRHLLVLEAPPILLSPWEWVLRGAVARATALVEGTAPAPHASEATGT